jgi:hypothetical protein
MPSPELDSLIVEHLADLDRAAARIGALEDQVFTTIGDKAQQWAGQKGWKSDFDYPTEGWGAWEAWVAPEEWRTPETLEKDNEFDAWFEFDVGDGDTLGGKESEDWFYLTRLCRVGVGQIGFRFKHSGIIKARQWNQNSACLNEIVAPTKFVPAEERSFFMPISIDPRVLAQTIKDEDLDAALKPFEEALDDVLASRPHFDKLIEHLRSLAA